MTPTTLLAVTVIPAVWLWMIWGAYRTGAAVSQTMETPTIGRAARSIGGVFGLTVVLGLQILAFGLTGLVFGAPLIAGAVIGYYYLIRVDVKRREPERWDQQLR